MKRTDKLEKLEKKLNIASSLVEDLTAVVEEFGHDLPALTDTVEGEIVVPEAEEVRVFEIDNLKTDFQIIRTNILKLVNNGQRILDTASVVDVADLSSKQLEALACMQQTIGNNLKLLIDCYKSIADIEKLRAKEQKKSDAALGGAINMGQVTNNNIIFSGGTNDLLDLIKQNQ